MNTTISEGVCEAPIINCDTGEVTIFFHLFDGTNYLSADLDDLVADGRSDLNRIVYSVSVV